MCDSPCVSNFDSNFSPTCRTPVSHFLPYNNMKSAASAVRQGAPAARKRLSVEEKQALAGQLDSFTQELERRKMHVVSLIQRLVAKGEASKHIRRQLQFREDNLKSALADCRSATNHVLTTA